MQITLIISFFLIASGLGYANADCAWHDSHWYHELSPYHSCNTNEWLAQTEDREGSMWYYCCNGEGFKQWVRDKFFRMAMFVGDKIGHKECLLHVLCESGCIDLIRDGPRDTNPLAHPGDSEYLQELLNAWNAGQKLAAQKNEKLCKSSCTKSYPGCKDSDKNMWKKLYTTGHKVGMGTFNQIEKLIDWWKNPKDFYLI